jgi:hypothetical protein
MMFLFVIYLFLMQANVRAFLFCFVLNFGIRYIYVRHNPVAVDGRKLPTVLECHGSVDSRLNLRVTGVHGDALKKLKMKNTQESSKKVRVYATSENPERQKADSERRARIRAKKWEATAARSRSHQLRPNMRETRLMEYDEDNIQEIKARVYADNEEEDIYEDSDSDERSRNHENSKRRYENKEGGDSSKKRMRQDSSDDDSEG